MATSSLDATTVILLLVALALITAAGVLIIFMRGSLKRLKHIDGTQQTKKTDESLRPS